MAKKTNDLMSTPQVAGYLGINEKKVYFLAKAGRIPCTRVTGKWIFPRSLIDRWIEESASGIVEKKAKEKSFLLAAGSDDPSLGILRDLYDSHTMPASLFMTTVGSAAGLKALRDGAADFALAHLRDPATGQYNLSFAREMLPGGTVVAALFYRELGLVLRPGNPKGIETVSDLARKGVRLINRQEGSGTRHYLGQELARLGIDPKEITGYQTTVPTHLEAGLKVLGGEADAGIATMTAARLLGLDFVPLTRERFDLLIPKDRFFSRAVQSLMGIVGSREFRSRVEAMGGYDASESGRIIAAG